MIELAAKGEISQAELQAMLAGKKMEIDHKERALVAEAAIDRRTPTTRGHMAKQPGGSGGDFNAGAKKKKAA
jgi:uncharacterized protein (DUF2336 family)